MQSERRRSRYISWRKETIYHPTKENCSDTTHKRIMLLLNASRMLLIWMLLFLFLFTFVSNFTLLVTWQSHSSPPRFSRCSRWISVWHTLFLLISYRMLHPVTPLTLLLCPMFPVTPSLRTFSVFDPKVVFKAVKPFVDCTVDTLFVL